MHFLHKDLLQNGYSEFRTLKIHFNADQHSSDTELSLIENIAFINKFLRLFRQELVKGVYLHIHIFTSK